MKYCNFEFETVNLVDGKISKKKKSAKYFIEDIDRNISLNMICIPSGKFIMGSKEEEYLQFGLPHHEVTISSFHMSQFQITEAQWLSVMTYHPLCKHYPKDAYEERKNHPITYISWLEAIEFCQKLSQLTGKDYRLPSEAEWEYACRAGTNTLYSFGDEINEKVANYWDYWEEKWKLDANCSYFDSLEVGSFYPNPFGLYDMHGNVFEYCHDSWHDNYDNAPNDGTAWINNDSNNSLIVMRGGSFDYYADNCRCDYRTGTLKNNDYYNYAIGFRVVCLARN